ncbi:MAG: superoxide dismutase [Candidatus Peribacteria bacterium]|jgi:Fe-Mn family superoxide dismutase|nr:superoxide dismutase [Candidatus Peribacteria bacterium]
MFTLPPLPYTLNALEPIFSTETLEYHYGKHHQAYIDKLNNLVQSTPDETKTLEDIVTTAQPGPLFNNAAQALNHQLFRQQFQPTKESNKPEGKLLRAIETQRGNFEDFQSAFETNALNNFGSGWTRLVKTPEGNLEILNTNNAGNPLTEGKIPLITVDVWEHAYYIDYRNRRADYLKNIWKIINWNSIASL